jgi:hypothetical protein
MACYNMQNAKSNGRLLSIQRKGLRRSTLDWEIFRLGTTVQRGDSSGRLACKRTLCKRTPAGGGTGCDFDWSMNLDRKASLIKNRLRGLDVLGFLCSLSLCTN